MINFEWLWLGMVLPLPWLIRRFSPAVSRAEQAALKVPFLEDFDSEVSETQSQNHQWPIYLAIAAWLFLVLASIRPQWLGEPIEQAVSGRDLMLAVDLSGSMDQQDFVIQNQRVNRMQAAKFVAGQFIERRVGDRLGLILFGTSAHLQAPLTFDRKTVNTLLQESFIGITDDEPATAIGDAIGLAVKRLRKHPADSRVLILLTDGANTAGEVTPLKAAELAADNQLKIYTIGMGADVMVVRDFFGSRRVNPSRDLDEKTLTTIAQMTGGRYFRARDTEELEQIYQVLDQLEPIEKDKQYFRPRTELYHWPLALALLLASVICLTRVRSN
jgi:Ca-activated chloride channel family protein